MDISNETKVTRENILETAFTYLEEGKSLKEIADYMGESIIRTVFDYTHSQEYVTVGSYNQTCSFLYNGYNPNTGMISYIENHREFNEDAEDALNFSDSEDYSFELQISIDELQDSFFKKYRRNIPYRKVAHAALINFNSLSFEEAERKIEEESFEQLESQIGAYNSMEAAIMSISKSLNLTDDDINRFNNAVFFGKDKEILNKVKKLLMEIGTFDISDYLKSQFVLSVLSDIHDDWVIRNSDQATFEKKVVRKQLRQYVPQELLGFNEVKSDYIFLGPILDSIGTRVDKNKLERDYISKSKDFINSNGIETIEDIEALVRSGNKYYPVLPKDLADKLSMVAPLVASQIADNLTSYTSRLYPSSPYDFSGKESKQHKM